MPEAPPAARAEAPAFGVPLPRGPGVLGDGAASAPGVSGAGGAWQVWKPSNPAGQAPGAPATAEAPATSRPTATEPAVPGRPGPGEGNAAPAARAPDAPEVPEAPGPPEAARPIASGGAPPSEEPQGEGERQAVGAPPPPGKPGAARWPDLQRRGRGLKAASRRAATSVMRRAAGPCGSWGAHGSHGAWGPGGGIGGDRAGRPPECGRPTVASVPQRAEPGAGCRA